VVGSFRNPPPGRPVGDQYDESLKVGEPTDDIDDAVARENFRVVIIRPSEVESTDLSDPATARRQLYTYQASDGSWKHETLWP
jgi:hypothetical protein